MAFSQNSFIIAQFICIIASMVVCFKKVKICYFSQFTQYPIIQSCWARVPKTSKSTTDLAEKSYQENFWISVIFEITSF